MHDSRRTRPSAALVTSIAGVAILTTVPWASRTLAMTLIGASAVALSRRRQASLFPGRARS